MKHTTLLTASLLLAVILTACSSGQTTATTAVSTAAPTVAETTQAASTTAAKPAETEAPKVEEKTYPEKGITILVPTAAGGAIDLSIRAVAAEMEKTLGQTITVVNKEGGAAGAVAEYYQTAKNDGYSYLAMDKGILSNHVTGTFIVGYEDFEPVGQLEESFQMIVCNAQLPYETLDDVIKAAKEKPGEITVGCSGTSGISFLSVFGFVNGTGADLKIVPYSGGAELKAAVSGGDVQLASLKTSEALPLAEGGYLKVLACCASEKAAGYENVPTLKELGIDFDITQATQMWAPKGTDAEQIKIFTAALKEAVNSDSFKSLCEKNLTNNTYLDPEELLAVSASEYAKIYDMLDAVGLAKK